MRKAGWLWAPVAAVAVVAGVPLTAFVATSALAGYDLGDVRTGSMEPTYPVGSLLVVEPVAPSSVRVGMPLSFVTPGSDEMVTHRVIGIVDSPRGPMFRTQGDANDTPDAALVPASAVRGQVRWAVPVVGSGLRWVVWPRGFLLLVVAPALLLVLTGLGERLRHGRRPARSWDDFDERYAVL